MAAGGQAAALGVKRRPFAAKIVKLTINTHQKNLGPAVYAISGASVTGSGQGLDRGCSVSYVPSTSIQSLSTQMSCNLSISCRASASSQGRAKTSGAPETSPAGARSTGQLVRRSRSMTSAEIQVQSATASALEQKNGAHITFMNSRAILACRPACHHIGPASARIVLGPPWTSESRPCCHSLMSATSRPCLSAQVPAARRTRRATRRLRPLRPRARRRRRTTWSRSGCASRSRSRSSTR